MGVLVVLLFIKMINGESSGVATEFRTTKQIFRGFTTNCA